MKLEKGVTTHEEMILDLIEKVKELMAKVEVIEKKIEDKADFQIYAEDDNNTVHVNIINPDWRAE